MRDKFRNISTIYQAKAPQDLINFSTYMGIL
jgi:hypothetical protein